MKLLCHAYNSKVQYDSPAISKHRKNITLQFHILNVLEFEFEFELYGASASRELGTWDYRDAPEMKHTAPNDACVLGATPPRSAPKFI